MNPDVSPERDLITALVILFISAFIIGWVVAGVMTAPATPVLHLTYTGDVPDGG